MIFIFLSPAVKRKGYNLILAAIMVFALDSKATRVIGIDDLLEMMDQKGADVHIINFWATCCGPWVKELPYFEKLTAEGNPDVKVTLVSVDLDLDPDAGKVHRFISRKKLRSHVVLLHANDPNTWIDAVDKKGSGSLPATLLINHRTGERKFIGRALLQPRGFFWSLNNQ